MQFLRVPRSKYTALLYVLVSVFTLKSTPHLFQKFPKLQDQIPYRELCDLPTPIVTLDTFGSRIGVENVYIKRDDLSGKNMGNGFRLYGGNKPRKLEFLLADALAHDAKTIITYGCAGSNHALATGVYAHELGLKALLMLKDQPNSYVVRHNLLLDKYVGAALQFYPNNAVRSAAAQEVLVVDPSAYLIPTGGSNEIGALGFVNAALELAAQIKEGVMPEPDYIYVATGSCATCAGLLLGMQLAELKSKVVAVCVEPEEERDEFLVRIKELFYVTNLKLAALDALIPLFDFPLQNVQVNKKYCGTEYGLFIPETMHAARVFNQLEDIMLEGTYSAKPIAAIMDDAQEGLLDGKIVVFWNTYCGIDYSHLFSPDDYIHLPEAFQRYFVEDVQPLARLDASF